MRLVDAVVYAAALLLPACAPASPSASPSGELARLFTLTPWTPPPGQSCEVFGAREPLPALDAIFDSAVVHAALAQLPERGAAVLSLQLDSLSQPRHLRVVDATLPESAQAAVQEAFTAHLRPNAPPQILARVRVDVGESVRFVVGKSEGCPPQIRNASEVAAAVRRLAQGAPQSGVAIVAALVNTDGTPSQLRINRSSGNSAVDRIALEAARTARFDPALLDRIPVAAWAQFPVNVVVP